jgi:hypothetical protein
MIFKMLTMSPTFKMSTLYIIMSIISLLWTNFKHNPRGQACRRCFRALLKCRILKSKYRPNLGCESAVFKRRGKRRTWDEISCASFCTVYSGDPLGASTQNFSYTKWTIFIYLRSRQAFNNICWWQQCTIRDPKLQTQRTKKRLIWWLFSLLIFGIIR